MGSDYYYVTWMFWPPLSLYTSWKWCWTPWTWLQRHSQTETYCHVCRQGRITKNKWEFNIRMRAAILSNQGNETHKHTQHHSVTACSPKIHPRSICCRTLQSSFFSRVETPVLFLHTPTFYIINTLSIDFFLELKSCKCSLIIEQFCVSLCWRLQM